MKYFIDYLNFCSILLFAYVCLFFQSTLLHQFFGIYKPSLLLILLSYLALNRFSIEGGILAFLLGYFIELNSGAPFGFYSCVLVLAFYASKIISVGFFVHTILSEMGFVIIVSIVYKICFLIILSLYEPIQRILMPTFSTLMAMAFLNVLLTPIIFFGLKQWDLFLNKELPSRTSTQESPWQHS
ncbi:MAG: hypothetical protein A2Z91_05455 [Deltaproteobacteria bacterium GWA2_38_16]|nr:MAG: hypothetical protein A2Z91_05455 [Deltaproteobacteria bacterium GWA2_38_16]OGQ03224.1 MAG: hypothetical protein A3D19_04180 [Deltaproteobacteria bacterium RIFCSPHIGHO2_02_FULL_38_15]OGQ34023.1 MAG: hypothetical protein A3A72_06550 [Deltaproteobacteria bacterium RIFCSPLOWO2_01_FULL_38_9]OGQ59309.1 MAG: hypothetical protein A3G92_05160 [Deltaproteobacteria bacterium RIFCSPLOWO2_12_FULL_38_8]HBQ20349.1 hypothetical protein [Deltaproteobacteria bacterium]